MNSDPKYIQELLDRYFDGTTTLEEEAALKAYFQGELVAPEHKVYASWFSMIAEEQQVSVPNDFKVVLPPADKKRKPVLRMAYWAWSAAAMLVLCLGLWWLWPKMTESTSGPQLAATGAKVIVLDENTDPDVAYQEFKKAMKLVSRKMKKGIDETNTGLETVKRSTQELKKVVEF